MAQRQPTSDQLDFAKRVLAHNHARVYAAGMSGTTIRALQIAMAAKGYAPGRFDGKWGDLTQAAFDKFMRDRGQVFGSATPKGLAFISKEIGQPLPRQRPAQPTDGLAVSGSADAGMAPPTDAAMSGAMPPAPMPVAPPPAPDPSQSQEREYDPNVLHAAVMNRNEPPDMAQQLPDYQPPIGMGSDPNQFGPDMQALSAMPPAPEPPPSQPNNFDMSRFDAAPMTSDNGVPDNLMETLRTTPPDVLRQALLMAQQSPPGGPGITPPDQSQWAGQVQDFGTGLENYIAGIPGAVGNAVGGGGDPLRAALLARQGGR